MKWNMILPVVYIISMLLIGTFIFNIQIPVASAIANEIRNPGHCQQMCVAIFYTNPKYNESSVYDIDGYRIFNGQCRCSYTMRTEDSEIRFKNCIGEYNCRDFEVLEATES